MSSFVGRFPPPRGYSEKEILANREVVPNYQFSKYLGFSLNRIHNLDRTKAKIDHSGCINIVKWDQHGRGFITGSDDRELKYWSLTNDVEEVVLKHSIRTRHRSNIFYADFDRVDENIYYSCAADGSLRSSHALERNVGELLRSSDDIIHMFHIDQDQPKVIYTAEEVGSIFRIDLRTGHSDKIFQHTKHAYRACQRNNVFQMIPTWSSQENAVKAVIQNHTYSAPHLIVGGQGFMVGMLDLRLASYPEMRNVDAGGATTPALTSFVKLWCPMFPMNTNSRNYQNVYEHYKHSSLSHPYGTSTNDPLVEGEFKLSYRRHASARTHQSASTSGLDISKDGRRLLVSYQGDQIYTFDFDDQSNNNCIGCRAYMGGHCNYATFLKSVHFFGPGDEYVVAGSDTGHMWIWSSFPKYISGVSTASSHVPRQLVTCPVWNILKADSRTCNGIAPHPSELLLISYGIDSSAKLWAVRNLDTGDNKVEEIITLASGRKISTDPSTYPLCRHDGPHDRSRYSRISVSKVLSSKPKSQFCALAMLPYLLEETKKNLDMTFPEFLNYPKTKNMVLFPSDYVSTAMLLRKCTAAMLFNPSNAEVMGPKHQYFKDDRGSFMPSDSLHDFFRTGIPIKDLSDYIFGTVKKWAAWSNKPNAFWHRLLRRYCIINMFRTTSMIELSMDYFLYLHYRGLDNNRSKLFNFFFLPVLALVRLAEDAKNNGSGAFRNKDYEYAHHFYCKAQRYIEFIFSLCLVPSLSSLSVKDNVPMEALSQWTKEKRMKQIPKAMYDINTPNPVKPEANPLSSAPILSRKLRSRLTRQLQAMGVPLNNEFFRRAARSGAVSSASDSSVSDSVGSASTVPSATLLNERGGEIVSSFFVPGSGHRLSPIQEDRAAHPSDATATSWTTVTETNVSVGEGGSSRPPDDVSQSMASSTQGTVTSTSMGHGNEDDDEEDDDEDDEDDDDDDDDDDDGDSELGLLRSGDVEFDEDLLDDGDEEEGSAIDRLSHFGDQLDLLTRRAPSATSAKARRIKAEQEEGMNNEEKIGSDIDDNALEGNVVRFILPALSSCPVFIANHKKELYKIQRFGRINRRYWRKVTLHPHGQNLLVRGELSPPSSADNSDGECEMCISSSNDEDYDESEDEHDPHCQTSKVEEPATATPVPSVTPSPPEGQSVPPVETAEPATVTAQKKTVGITPKNGCNSPLCCCCGTKGTYPSPELNDLLSEPPVISDDAEMDTLILADDCSHWFDTPFVYDPVWRKHQRVNLKSLNHNRTTSIAKGEGKIDSSDNCDADDEGEDRMQERLAEGDSPNQKRRRLGSPSNGLPPSSSQLSTATDPSNNPHENGGHPLDIDNKNANDNSSSTSAAAAVDSNHVSSSAASNATATGSSVKDDKGKFDRDFLSAISKSYLDEILAHKATGANDADNNNDTEEIRFETNKDFFVWELSPKLAKHLHQQAYELMKYIYDEHLVTLMLTVYSNLAATFIAMEKFVDARHVCEDAFRFARILDLPAHQIDAKLYFRRAVCYLHLHMYEEAVKDLQEAAALQPKDALIANKLKEAKRLQDNKRKTEIRAYSRMFGDSSSK